MKRKIIISKRNLFWSAISPLLYGFLVIWGIVVIIFIIAAVTSGTNIVDAFIGSGLLFVFLISFIVIFSLYMLPGFACIKRQEDWFRAVFNLELKNEIIQYGLYIGQMWYVCISGMRLFAIRKGYVTKVASTKIENRKQRSGTIVTVNTIDNRTMELHYQCGDEDRVKALIHFIQN